MAGLVKLLRGWEWPLVYTFAALAFIAPFGFPGPALPPCPQGSQAGCFAHCVTFSRADVTAGRAPGHFDQFFLDNVRSWDTLPGARFRCPAERFDVVGERVGFALVLLPLAAWVTLNRGFARGTALVALLLTSTGVVLELFGPPEELQTYVFEIQRLTSIRPTYDQSSSWSGITVWPTEVRTGLGDGALLLMIGLSPLRLAWRFVGPRLKPGATRGLAGH